MVRVRGLVLPADSVAELLTLQVTVVGVHLKLTAPAKLFTDETLMVVVPDPPAVTGTMVVSGTMEKSESGFEMALPLFRVMAERL